MSWPVAACIVVERDGAILGVSRKDKPGAFGLPGGKVELGEPPAHAAARELLEETGLRVDPASLVLVLQTEELGTGSLVATFWAPDPGGPVCAGPGEGLVCWVGWPTVLSGPFGAYNRMVREALVQERPEHWIATYGSGSLRRAVEEGLRWREMYLGERVALEFGYGFEPVQASRCQIGDALASSDDPGTTETCWWARALRYRARRDGRYDVVRVVHARVSGADGDAQESVAIHLTPSPWPSWLPRDRRLLALTVGKDGRTVNPC